MIGALLKKDLQLLRVYWQAASVFTLAPYLISGAIVYEISQYPKWLLSPATRALVILNYGSNLGLAITAFVAALIAGSAIPLERIDRSAEFLACLPPTRKQILISKLTIIFGITISMVTVHTVAVAIGHQLLPYARHDQSVDLVLPSLGKLALFLAATVSVTGGSFAASAWCNSNGIPTLCGLLTPAVAASLVSLIGYWLDVSSEGESFQARYLMASLALGCTFLILGSYWYLTRSEP